MKELIKWKKEGEYYETQGQIVADNQKMVPSLFNFLRPATASTQNN